MFTCISMQAVPRFACRFPTPRRRLVLFSGTRDLKNLINLSRVVPNFHSITGFARPWGMRERVHCWAFVRPAGVNAVQRLISERKRI
jgi:hypothetical protein